MKTIWLFLMATGLLLFVGQPQGIDCSQNIPKTLHSDSCPNSLVESDAGKIASLHLKHNPPYHTYSRWNVSSQNYILAYWDEDNDLLGLYADYTAKIETLLGTLRTRRWLRYLRTKGLSGS